MPETTINALTTRLREKNELIIEYADGGVVQIQEADNGHFWIEGVDAEFTSAEAAVIYAVNHFGGLGDIINYW
jgi:hypothetical protein